MYTQQSAFMYNEPFPQEQEGQSGLPTESPLYSLRSQIAQDASSVAPKAHYWWKRIFVGTGILIAVLVVAFYTLPYILNLITSDILPIDDSDLIPVARVVSDTENGFRFVEPLNTEVKRTGLTNVVLDDLLKNQDTEKTRLLLEENRNALDLFQKIADAPVYQDPALGDPSQYSYNTVITPLGDMRQLTRLSLLDAYVAFAGGNATATVVAIVRPLRVADNIASPNTNLITVLVAMVMYKRVYDELGLWIDNGLMDKQTLEQVFMSLKSHGVPDFRDSLVSAYKGEYVLMRNLLQNIGATGKDVRTFICAGLSEEECDSEIAGGSMTSLLQGSYYFRPNETMASYANLSRVNIEVIDQYCESPRPPVYETWHVPSPAIRLVLEENAIGKMFYSVWSSGSPEGVIKRSCELKEKYAQLMKSLEGVQP
ncbi:MAG: hypothetical protein KBD21_03665 [Candidatus Pacebacteria bacterium]|nr:hypothetical protein [Candidatus Paceibacterota bacterium]